MKPSRRILIVDDTEHAATTLEVALLSIAGVTVCVVASASEALELLQSGEAVSTIITDLNMPHMDGLELIARVRQVPGHQSVPIIVISADTDPRTPERLARLGAAAFFPKPFSPARVRQKVEQLLDAIPASESHTLT